MLGFTLSLNSCKDKQNSELSTEEQLAEAARRDSAALHVSIFPSEVCLPFYYAEATGIYDSMDVDIRFMHLNSMEDCDTALLGQKAEVAVTDVARLINMQKIGQIFTAIASMNGHLTLLGAKDKNIKDIKQLKERLLALDRHSETDFLSDDLTGKRDLEQLDVFRTQFNRHNIRLNMLDGSLVDAAFLDEPWATLALENGANSLWKRSVNDLSWEVLAANQIAMTDSTRNQQIKKLIKGYNLAVQCLNKGQLKEKYDSILVYAYSVNQEALDSIEALRSESIGFKALAPTSDSIVNIAKNWLVDRKWINPKQNTSHLTSQKFVSK